MAGSLDFAAGTVSKILWHFTGPPRWNDITREQENHPKPAIEAYQNLQLILHPTIR
jgi:hypothetical protein